jgi:hypothetical protein
LTRRRGLTRRTFLEYSVLAAGAALAAGCDTPSQNRNLKSRYSGVSNVRVSRADAAGYVECSIAVNPTDTRNLIAAAMVFRGSGSASTPLVGTFASRDGGQAWSENGTLSLPAGSNHSNDPTAAFDVKGRGFVAAMATIQTEQGISSTDRGVYVWRTDDGGRTFGSPVAAVRGQFADHPWVAAGVGGDERLYVSWRTRDAGGLLLSRSSDGGVSFETPRRIIPTTTQTAIDRSAVGPGGAVYCAYAAPRGRGYQLEVVSSHDHGGTFASPVTIGPILLSLEQPGGTRIENGPGLAVSPVDGSAFVAYPGYKPETTEAALMLARSRDGGATWGTAVALSQPHDSAMLFQPEVAVEEAGTVLVTYLALVHDRVEVRLVRSIDKGGRFGPSQTITTQPFDPKLSTVAAGDKHGAWFLGDYQGLAVGGGSVHALWSDTRTGRPDLFTARLPAR